MSVLSSVGRAFDCNSKCRWFDSGRTDFFYFDLTFTDDPVSYRHSRAIPYDIRAIMQLVALPFLVSYFWKIYDRCLYFEQCTGFFFEGGVVLRMAYTNVYIFSYYILA